MAPMEDVKEELVQVTVPVQAAMGPAVTLAWLPIDTAMKVNAWSILITGRYPNGIPYVEESWWDTRGHWHNRKLEPPTHWMPLPEPPESSLTADPGPGTVGGSLEPNTVVEAPVGFTPGHLTPHDVLLAERNRLREALHLIRIEVCALDNRGTAPRTLKTAIAEIDRIARTALSAQGEMTDG